MALIFRIDVDRPYGRRPLGRHVISRLASDYYWPRTEAFGYLSELKIILGMLNEQRARAYVFFRRCTLPSTSVISLLEAGRHEAGLHLENSRSYVTFIEEKRRLERHLGRSLTVMTKHGSGRERYGRRHYAPYEPEKYVDWAGRSGMKLFFGNLEDPQIEGRTESNGVSWFPGAFWLETPWRDTERFPVRWLLDEWRRRDVVLLIHPENVLADPLLTEQFQQIVHTVESAVIT